MTTTKHSSVSLDYLQEQLDSNHTAHIHTNGDPSELALITQRTIIQIWRSKGYAYAPPCNNVTPDGRCAGHKKGA